MDNNKTTPSPNILTNVVEITGGPYAGRWGRLGASGGGKRLVHLDEAISVPEGHMEIDGVLHVGTSAAYKLRSVWVKPVDFHQLNEVEMVEKFG